MKLKQILKNKLTKKELSLVPTSFDTIGDIILFNEFPKQLIKKEKLIANILLKQFNNIKVIAKKTGKYSGKYRLSKIKIIAGENRKETTHRENNCLINLDIEKCYFSSRLANERLRIAKQVKNESVLVMFSGVGVYPLVISKNSKAKEIYAIEINPTAHEYAKHNIILNKSKNIKLFFGDVKYILPSIENYNIGLKAKYLSKQLNPRLKEKPHLIEFYLREQDLKKNYKKLEAVIKKLKKKNMEIMLHEPTIPKVNYLTYKKLFVLCKKYNLLGFVIHPYYHKQEKVEEQEISKKLFSLRKFYDYIYIENIPRHKFARTEHLIEIIKNSKIKNFCVDLSHFYITYKNTEKIIQAIKEIQKYCNTYFHINDSNGILDSMEIGKGDINIKKIIPYINKGVTEIISKDEEHPVEMIRSYRKFLTMIPEKKFDRIIMPLPTNAKSYLGLALNKINKNGIIHFYDFQKENEFDKSIKNIQKICKKAKKKIKILKIVKCGQFSPRVFRICVDFKVL